MVRPCVARGFVDPVDAVSHQCIRPVIGAYCAPGHHGYQRAFDLIAGQTSNGPFGSPVFACAGKTGSIRFGTELRFSAVRPSVASGSGREWRRLFITGATPEDAAERAQLLYNNTRLPFERMRKR
jgi:hypothetical protein